MGFKDPNKNDVMYEWCSAGWLSYIKCVLKHGAQCIYVICSHEQCSRCENNSEIQVVTEVCLERLLLHHRARNIKAVLLSTANKDIILLFWDCIGISDLLGVGWGRPVNQQWSMSVLIGMCPC